MNSPQLAMMIKRLKKRCDQRLERIKQLERERDALADLYKPHSNCESCKHNGSKLCDNCTNKNNCWKWAGIKEDNP